MENKFFKSKKNLITFIVATCLSVAIIATVFVLLLVKAPKPEFVSAVVGEYFVQYDKNGIDKNLIIREYRGKVGNFRVDIPEKIVINNIEYTVTKLADKALSGERNANIKEMLYLTLPTSINEIGDKAFEYTTNLTTLHLKGQVDSYGKDIFYKSGVTNLTIDNLTAGYNYRTFAGINLSKLIINNIVGDINDFTIEYANTILTKELYLGEDVVDATMLKPTIQNVETLSYFASTTLFNSNFLSSAKMTTLYINGLGSAIEVGELSDVADAAKATIKNIYLDEACDTINANVFNGFSALENVYMYGVNLNINLDALSGANVSAKIKFISNTNVSVNLRGGTTTEVTSAFINKLDVTKISNIIISNGITALKSSAFANVKNLAFMNFKSNSTVQTIDNGAFGTLYIAFTGPVDTNHEVYKRLHSTDFISNVKSYNA